MMYNILFITQDNVHSLYGGISRAIYNISSAFQENNMVRCYGAYFSEKPILAEDFVFFDDDVQIESWHNLFEYIRLKEINIIIVNTPVKKGTQEVLEALDSLRSWRRKISILFWMHYKPGYELKVGINIGVAFQRIMYQKNKFKSLQKLLIGLINSFVSEKRRVTFLSPKYALIYNHVDCIVLLSDGYKANFLQFIRERRDKVKLCSIPNSLSDSFSFDGARLGSKKEKVLIVARIDEDDKRISLALKIWAQIERRYSNWELDIVGDGPDMAYCLARVRKLQLKNISFKGWLNPIESYRDASVFMMTSAYEGFPMTLLEAMQMGVVPVVFNSFAAVNDLITDSEDGFIVEDNDVEGYTSCLLKLLENNSMRQAMATKAMTSSGRFSKDNVAKDWLELFKDVL